ncbi:hypothetical protein BHW_0900022 (plasmid) [Borrelia hermsii MTW]|uniref:Uncharacterized protein n=1 Tax=Borrelia hermsii MTW TaxID=1313291 RepID=W5T5W6_BORHE|nr:hypothetical protein BHW_0900022 [Borrelia hermsii MTW]
MVITENSRGVYELNLFSHNDINKFNFLVEKMLF